ncbi:MAG: crossover junction endodeoxyribonuclease RuvC [Candidatus Aminicenantaceae bacterium]
MIVLGIDPSVRSTGFGIIDECEGKYSVISYGVIKPSPLKLFHHKINEIRTNIENIISNYKPDEVAIENLFYAQNIKTALTLGQTRGAVLIAVASCDCNLYEYSPLEIKKAVTGYGQANKHQVQKMIKTLLNIEDDKMGSDESDALAAAFCHLNSRSFLNKIYKQDRH